MNDMTDQSERANAQDIVDRMTAPRRYDSLTYSVSTLNEQITELAHNNQILDDGIDAWEGQIAEARNNIRKAKRQKAKNDEAAAKLRAKRSIVAEAAFKAAALDQP